MLQPCPCRMTYPVATGPYGGASALKAQILQGIGEGSGPHKPLTPAENLEILKAALGPARTRYFTRRHAVSLAVRSAREGHPDDLEALAVLFTDWQSARYELDATEAQITQAEKEAKSNG